MYRSLLNCTTSNKSTIIIFNVYSYNYCSLKSIYLRMSSYKHIFSNKYAFHYSLVKNQNPIQILPKRVLNFSNEPKTTSTLKLSLMLMKLKVLTLFLYLWKHEIIQQPTLKVQESECSRIKLRFKMSVTKSQCKEVF